MHCSSIIISGLCIWKRFFFTTICASWDHSVKYVLLKLTRTNVVVSFPFCGLQWSSDNFIQAITSLALKINTNILPFLCMYIYARAMMQRRWRGCLFDKGEMWGGLWLPRNVVGHVPCSLPNLIQGRPLSSTAKQPYTIETTEVQEAKQQPKPSHIDRIMW